MYVCVCVCACVRVSAWRQQKSIPCAQSILSSNVLSLFCVQKFWVYSVFKRFESILCSNFLSLLCVQKFGFSCAHRVERSFYSVCASPVCVLYSVLYSICAQSREISLFCVHVSCMCVLFYSLLYVRKRMNKGFDFSSTLFPQLSVLPFFPPLSHSKRGSWEIQTPVLSTFSTLSPTLSFSYKAFSLYVQKNTKKKKKFVSYVYPTFFTLHAISCVLSLVCVCVCVCVCVLEILR